jgi:ElaB/YqjD/DUF883 family membrane-anchored ribosome-binding protein
MESPSSGTADLRDELRADAQTVTDTAKERLHSEVDSRKGEAASQAKNLSSALEDAAGKLDPSTPNWLKSALEQGAHAVQQLAETVEQKDSRQLVSDVQRLARDNPGTFLAGCALVGFAAARVFRAGASGVGNASSTPYGSSRTQAFASPGHTLPSTYELDNAATGGIQTHTAGQTGSAPGQTGTGLGQSEFSTGNPVPPTQPVL